MYLCFPKFPIAFIFWSQKRFSYNAFQILRLLKEREHWFFSLQWLNYDYKRKNQVCSSFERCEICPNFAKMSYYFSIFHILKKKLWVFLWSLGVSQLKQMMDSFLNVRQPKLFIYYYTCSTPIFSNYIQCHVFCITCCFVHEHAEQNDDVLIKKKSNPNYTNPAKNLP